MKDWTPNWSRLNKAQSWNREKGPNSSESVSKRDSSPSLIPFLSLFILTPRYSFFLSQNTEAKKILKNVLEIENSFLKILFNFEKLKGDGRCS